MGVSYFKDNGYDEITPCELSDNNLAVFSAADILEYAEVTKVWT